MALSDLLMNETNRSQSTLRRTNLVDEAYDELSRRITVGELSDGQRLNIDDIARGFGTSTIPVREALARLLTERLVIHVPNKGYRVAPAPDAAEIVHLFDARLILELGALERGIDNVTPAVTKRMTVINDQIRKTKYGAKFEDFREFVALNAEFHQIIIDLNENPLIQDAYHRLGYHQRIPHTLHGHGVTDIDRIISEHDAIVDALRLGSLETARSALKAHILGGLARLEMP